MQRAGFIEEAGPIRARRGWGGTWVRLVPVGALGGFASVVAVGHMPALWPLLAGAWGLVVVWRTWRATCAPPPTVGHGTDAAGTAAWRVVELNREVLPIWTAQVRLATQHLSDAMTALTARFAGMSGRLHGTMSAAQAQGGDGLAHALARAQEELGAVLEAFGSALDARDRTMQDLVATADSVKRLGGMVESVGEIARQTNLLSLNAAIEAARAGPAGRGFAIVAQEVRRLSQDSARTGEEIAQLIQGVSKSFEASRTSYQVFARSDAEMLAHTRQAIQAVMAHISQVAAQVVGTSTSLVNECMGVRGEIDEVLVAVQAQDRIAQMLQHTHDDQRRLLAALDPLDARGLEPGAWLGQLRSTYTTPEEIAIHDGEPLPEPATPASAAQQGETTFF